MTTIVTVLFGLAVLTLGRKLYWLFVGLVGFVLGITLGGIFFTGESELVILVIALVAGIVGALLAVFLQRMAIGIAGFIVGGYLLAMLFEAWNWQLLPYWMFFLIGGVVGAVLVTVLVDWALIGFSVFFGALLLVQAFTLPQWLQVFLFIFLVVIGVGMQTASLRSERAQA